MFQFTHKIVVTSCVFSGKDNSKEESDYKEEENPLEVVTRDTSKDDANSVSSKKEPLEKGANGDGN